MSNVDRQRIAAVRNLEQMGYTFADGDWVQPANEAVAPVITDALHALLVRRADALMTCPEESVGACEIAAISDAVDAYVAARWPDGRVDDGKG